MSRNPAQALVTSETYSTLSKVDELLRRFHGRLFAGHKISWNTFAIIDQSVKQIANSKNLHLMSVGLVSQHKSQTPRRNFHKSKVSN
jgi:hypothetical protein